jgi:hypothetical protein
LNNSGSGPTFGTAFGAAFGAAFAPPAAFAPSAILTAGANPAVGGTLIKAG